MLFQEMLKEERAEGRAEGREEGRAEGREEGRAEGRAEGREEGREEGRIALATTLMSFLEDKGVIPENLRDKIVNEKDLEVLGKWMKLAAKTESIDQFIEKM